MRFWPLLVLTSYCCLFAISRPTSAQTSTVAQPFKPGADGFYNVDASELKRLEPSPKLDFPRELSAYEVADTVVVALTISTDGGAEGESDQREKCRAEKNG